MGDRANIVMREGTNELYFYSHWCGYKMKQIAAKGIDRAIQAGRIGDYAYASRVIFCEVLKECSQDPDGALNESTGVGLSPFLTDGEYPLIIVNLDNCSVDIDDKSWSYPEFIKEFRATNSTDDLQGRN